MADEYRTVSDFDEEIEKFYDGSHRAVLWIDSENKCKYASNRFWILFHKIVGRAELPQIDFLDKPENHEFKHYLDSVRVYGVFDKEVETKINGNTKYFKVLGECRGGLVLVEIFDISESKLNALLVKKARRKIAAINLSRVGIILGIVGFLSTSVGIFKEYLNQNVLKMQKEQVENHEKTQANFLQILEKQQKVIENQQSAISDFLRYIELQQDDRKNK